jgi:hypothetical protein
MNTMVFQGPSIVSGLPTTIVVDCWELQINLNPLGIDCRPSRIKLNVNYIKLKNVKIKYRDQEFLFPELVATANIEANILPFLDGMGDYRLFERKEVE